jgi:mannosyltransferase OCH1-like enzyme
MIPKVIYQTWVSKKKNESVDVNRRTWIDKNPTFEYEYFDDDDIEIFIKDNFDDNVFACYKRIINGSLKADLFRYCILYVRGGVYIDVDIKCIEPLEKIFDFDNITYIVSTDLCSINRKDNLYQAFLAGEPKMQLFMNAIKHICDSMKENKYKFDLFLLSGPNMFSRITKNYMNHNMQEGDGNPIRILCELEFKKPSTKEWFVVVTHECKGETLKKKGHVIASCQHRIVRQGTPHYFHDKRKYKDGYYL